VVDSFATAFAFGRHFSEISVIHPLAFTGQMIPKSFDDFP